MLKQHYMDPTDRVGVWARGFVRGTGTDTLALLGDLNASFRQLGYRTREEEGTQTPLQTLQLRSGSCRDFAVLLAEAARSLGFGARIVTGYLSPSTGATPAIPPVAGTTHAWAEIFVPGPGWLAFDPTNGTVGGDDLIRVAVARDIHQIVPIAGSFNGAAEDYLGMEVDVLVQPAQPQNASAAPTP
jgi:transglutaminase-like putative cysteine protease